MAICYHKIAYGSLGKASSAHAVGYITGTRQIDARTGVVRSYEDRNDVAEWGHLFPEDAPEWVKDAGTYWNTVDTHVSDLIEKRFLNKKSYDFMKESARTRQSVIIALPKELDLEDYSAFAKTLYEEIFKARGCVATYAIHTDDGNPHLHFITSLYQLEDGKLLENVDRTMYSSHFRIEQRHLIGDFFNPILERKGFNERINVQSYKEMGLDIEAQIHEGPYARKLAQEGRGTRVSIANELIRDENAAKILIKTQDMLKLLAAHYATFNEKNMYEFIFKHMKGDPLLTAHVFNKVKEDVVKISGYSRDTNLYTTKEYKRQEDEAIQISNEMLSEKSSLFVAEKYVERYLEKQDKIALAAGKHTMSDEQKNAVRLLCSDNQLTYLVGRAGTGKTTSLKAVVDLYAAQKTRVFGAAIAAEAAQNLENEAGVLSKTIDSYLYPLKQVKVLEKRLEDDNLDIKERAKIVGKISSLKDACIKSDSVLIVDEAGMVGVSHFFDLFSLARERNIKLIFVGDDRQFKSVNAGDLFRYLIEKAGEAERSTELSQNYRQAKVPWMSRVSMEFAELNIIDSLKAYDEHNLIHRFEKEEDLLDQMTKEYLEIPAHESCCVLSFTNENVDKLNQKIRKGLQDLNRLSKEETIIEDKPFAVGDSFIFLKNAKQTSDRDWKEEGKLLSIEGKGGLWKIRNGMRGTILKIEEVEDPLIAIYEAKGIFCDKKEGGRKFHYLEVLVKEKGEDHVVKFMTNTYYDFSHGYATTLHKSQGQTVDRTLLYVTKHMDLYATYVAFTRHREHMHAYHLNKDFPTFNVLCNHLGKINVKDLVQDHSSDNASSVVEMVSGYLQMGLLISETLSCSSPDEKEVLPYLMEEKEHRAMLMLSDFTTYAPYLLSRGITKKQLEIAAGLVERVLSKEELEIKATIHAYVDVSKLCRETYEELIKTHPSVYIKHHENYDQLEDLQERRGELAHRLQQSPVLLQAYSKDIFEACNYGLKTVEKQAHEHVKLLAKKAVLSSLSAQDQEYVALYEEGVLYEREGRKLFMQNKAYDEDYQELKKKTKPQKLIFKTMVTSERLQQQDYIQNAGAGVMYYFKKNPQILNRVLSIIQTYDTLDEKEVNRRMEAANRFEDQLIVAKAAGMQDLKAFHDAHTLLHSFDCTAEYNLSGNAFHTYLSQIESSAHLVDRIEGEKRSGAKAVTKAKIMSQAGFEGLIQIYNQARDANRLKVPSLFGRESIHGELIALVEYGQAQQEVYHWWKLVKEEAQKQNIAYAETQHYEDNQKASAQKDIAAFYAVELYGMNGLRRANALLKEKNLGLRIDNLEREAERGRIHHACQTLNNPLALEHVKEDARDTLLIANLLETEAYFKAGEDKPSRYVYGIMSSYDISSRELAQGLSAFKGKTKHVFKLDDFEQEKPLIEAYKEAIVGFSKAYIALVKDNPEGSKALRADTLSPEAIAVHEAVEVRNAAAYALYQTNFLSTFEEKNIQGLYRFLKVSQSQFIKQVDEYESKQLVPYMSG